MTNRRKGTKARATASKKSETPEKQTRKLNRRSRRNRKSDSPEQPEEIGSEYSIDENTDDDRREVFDNERENDGTEREHDQYELSSKSVDDQKSQIKEEESGGSDGSWKVKSENGGSGGIPKLKLCLTRPPEVSSPTPEQPSPRRRRRGRGVASPSKDELQHQQEEVVSDDKQSPKRSSRIQKVKEVAEHEPQVQEKLDEAIKSVEIVAPEACKEMIEPETQVEETMGEPLKSEEIERPETFEDNTPETHVEEKIVEPSNSIEIVRSEACDSTSINHSETEEETQLAVDSIINVQKQDESDLTLTEISQKAEEESSHSRNMHKLDISDEAEVIGSPNSQKVVADRMEDSDKSETVQKDSSSDAKENQEECIPVKVNNRKRRWGASSNRVSKKPSVSISTDFLKEIIPEVKPLPMSEVQLSPNEEEEEDEEEEEEEEGQVKDSEENMPVIAKKVEREKMVQSDESEKDYEEETVESGVEESPKNETMKTIPQVKEKELATFTRKVSVLSSNDMNKLQRSPSPPRHKPSNILYIVNLVRPFTTPQLLELLARTGTITKDGFWIDKIKSKCYVKYETEEEAKTTRHALHGVRWPISNPKQLNVDFGTEAAMKAAQEGNEILPKRSLPSLFDKSIDIKSNEKSREREERNRDKKDRSEKEKKDSRTKHREEEEKDKKARPPVEPLVRDRTVRRVTVPVREWDVGKNEDGFSPPPDGIEFGRHRDDRFERRVEYERDKRDEYDERRRRDKDRSRRSVSNELRKAKKKNEDEAPAKLLDDLFRKTKATPCIYWLPLTSEQIAVKEELRRKHMAEHEKRVAELRKIQRDQNKRRRRSKSRSRSRTPKKSK